MATVPWQGWTTIRGGSPITSITQDEEDLLDVSGFADAAIWLEVRELTGTSLTLNLETAPSKDEVLFQPVCPPVTLAVSSTPVLIKTVRSASTAPLARWLRWRITGSGNPWDAVFRLRVKASKAQFFNPPDIPGCQLWLRGDLGMTVNIGNNTVTAWNDQSGNGFNASQTTPPIYGATAMNGHPAIQGTGTQYMTTSSFAMGSSATILTAVQPTAGSEALFARIVEADAGTSYYLGCDGVTGTHYKFIVDSTTSPYGNATGGSVQSGINTLVTGIFSAAGSTGTGTLYVNGASVAFDTFNTPSPPALSLFLMRKDSASSSFWTGYLGEVIVYNRALTASELTIVHRYLGGRYAVSVP